MSTPAPTYWAFLSYSSHDLHWARWLHRALETFPVPPRLRGAPTPAGPAPRRLRPVFRDRAELAASADLKGRIETALEGSAWLVVICSPRAAASEWVNAEIERFRAFHGPDRILALIVAGSPGDDYEDCFPPALRYSEGMYGAAEGAEPIAADLRPDKDGRRMAVLKIVAGMLGVGLDDLARRDEQRRQRRLAAIAIAATIGMAITGGLAVAALRARDEARAQRAQAEGLIEYMLGDLRKRLEPSGRLDVMDGIGRRALAYYAAQRPGELDADSLARRARALSLMGQISAQRGHLEEAKRSFEKALGTTAEMVVRSPGDGARLYDHAQNVYWIGYVDWQRGDMAQAEARFQEYLSLAQRLTAVDPHKDDWQAEVGYAWSDLGSVLLEQGRAREAAAAHGRALAVAGAVAARAGGDPLREMDVAANHAWLADDAERQGQLAQTRDHRQTELGICAKVLAKDHSYQEAIFSTVVALRALGRLDLMAGRNVAAVAEYRQAVARAEALLASQPDDMVVDAAVGNAQVDLGEALLSSGALADAEAADQRARSLLDVAIGQDSSVAAWRRYRDQSRLLEAAIAAREGRLDEAFALDARTLASLARETLGGVNTYQRWLLNRARLQTGDDLWARGRPEEARALWMDIADRLGGPPEAYEPRLLRLIEAADTRLRRGVAARQIHRRREAIGDRAR